MWIKLIPTWKVLHLDSETQAKGNLEIVYYTKQYLKQKGMTFDSKHVFSPKKTCQTQVYLFQNITSTFKEETKFYHLLPLQDETKAGLRSSEKLYSKYYYDRGSINYFENLLVSQKTDNP